MTMRRNEFLGTECMMDGESECAGFRRSGHAKADLDEYMVGYRRIRSDLNGCYYLIFVLLLLLFRTAPCSLSSIRR